MQTLCTAKSNWGSFPDPENLGLIFYKMVTAFLSVAVILLTALCILDLLWLGCIFLWVNVISLGTTLLSKVLQGSSVLTAVPLWHSVGMHRPTVTQGRLG